MHMDRFCILDELASMGMKDHNKKELVLTLEGQKPATKIFGDFPGIESFCRRHGLSILRASYCIKKNIDSGKNGWSNSAKKATDGTPVFFISGKEEDSKRAKQYDEENNDMEFGKIMGYPECDINFFLNNREKANSKQRDFALLTLKNTSANLPYNYLNNFISRYFGYSLISHFPHSFNCKKSAEMAEDNYRTLCKYSKRWANRFVRAQKSVILFSEYDGVFMLKNYTYNKTLTYDPGELGCTCDNFISKALSSGNNIEIIGKNHLIIKKNNVGLLELEGEDYGIMIFE